MTSIWMLLARIRLGDERALAEAFDRQAELSAPQLLVTRCAWARRLTLSVGLF